MKQLVLIRGFFEYHTKAFVKEYKISDKLIDLNQLNSLVNGDVVIKSGKVELNSYDHSSLIPTLKSILDVRLNKQLLTFIDITPLALKDLNEILALAKFYNYKIKTINLNPSLEELIKKNKIIDQTTIDKIRSKIASSYKLPPYIKVLSRENWKKEILLEYFIDISQYENIFVISDLQGCYKPLHDFFKDHEYSKHNLYIFLGDYCDRGIENHLTIAFCLENMHKQNFVFLEGNHEYHLNCLVRRSDFKSHEFEFCTKPQLEETNTNIKKLKDFLYELKEFIVLKGSKKNYFLTHCGSTMYPSEEDMLNLSGHEFTYKMDYNSSIDQEYTMNEKKVIQIHGHRNNDSQNDISKGRSFALEGNVEYGGNLKIVKISNGKEELLKYINPISKASVECLGLKGYATKPVLKNEFKMVEKYGDEGLSKFYINPLNNTIIARSLPLNQSSKDILGLISYNVEKEEIVFIIDDNYKKSIEFKKLFLKEKENILPNIKRFLRNNRVTIIIKLVEGKFEIVDIVENTIKLMRIDPKKIEKQKKNFLM